MKRVVLLFMIAAGMPGWAQPAGDTILRSMRDELERSRTLRFPGLEEPYFIEYTLDDAHAFMTQAALGATLGTNDTRLRIPRVRVRVGSRSFDNTNYLFSDFGARTESAPIDDDYNVLRREWWLSTDRSYKAALEVIARKRAALKNITQQEAIPDFWPAPPLQKILPVGTLSKGGAEWEDRARALSLIFTAYPEVISSQVDFSNTESVYYMTNTEGAVLRRPEPVAHLNAKAQAFAPDGSIVRDAVSIPRLEVTGFPAPPDLAREVQKVADNVRLLAKAPAGESYSGPVLFEGLAGAQIVAEVLGPHFPVTRKPIGEPGRPMPVISGELDNKLESRILPEFLSIVDDPTQKEFQGTPLLGSYEIDEEGVSAGPVTLVENGRLKAFLLTRQPIPGQKGSNGRARMPGSFGAHQAAITNLFVNSSQTVKAAELRQRFLKMLQDRNKPWGIIVRKMDFPSSASNEEARRLISAAQQSGTRPVSEPVLTYKVFPDGREELIRGLRFRGLTVRSFRDIQAVSEERYALHYLNNLLPFAILGAGGYIAPTSVIAPALLFDELELERRSEDVANPPIVPAPELRASNAR